MSESDLIAACRLGDHRAFADLVGRYRTHAWHVCLQITGNTHDAEDAAADGAAHQHRGRAPDAEASRQPVGGLGGLLLVDHVGVAREGDVRHVGSEARGKDGRAGWMLE